ncbi:MAG: hypothetical protein HFP81_01920 [Methylococcales symbiont of Hymedesmia sp. n. MRB-2018]|nr:MAG: hypothetical protein HFP81_01920 [Methylococcales symbiont of Hymedesmia sp. n. MRB-2018]
MKTNLLSLKTPIALAIGVFITILLISACESVKTPSQVTLIFWNALAKDDLSLATKQCNLTSQPRLDSPVISLNKSNFDFGKIIIDGSHATVETFITPSINNKSSFTTFLSQEKQQWKIDCHKSLKELSNRPFNSFFKSLDSLGKNITKQLKQQLPKIKKEINAFAEELKQQADKFGKELEKTLPQKQTESYQNTI